MVTDFGETHKYPSITSSSQGRKVLDFEPGWRRRPSLPIRHEERQARRRAQARRRVWESWDTVKDGQHRGDWTGPCGWAIPWPARPWEWAQGPFCRKATSQSGVRACPPNALVPQGRQSPRPGAHSPPQSAKPEIAPATPTPNSVVRRTPGPSHRGTQGNPPESSLCQKPVSCPSALPSSPPMRLGDHTSAP